MARCVGQNCFSVTRPFIPNVPVYDYRKDFNYPWSQAPCALPGPPPIGAPEVYELIDEPADGPEVVSPPPLAALKKSKSRGTINARRGGEVLVTDRGVVPPAKQR
jgi:hypothetical protein